MKTYIVKAYLGQIRAKFLVQAKSKKKALKKVKEKNCFFKKWKVKLLKTNDGSLMYSGKSRE